MLMALVLALFIGSPVAGRLLDRFGSRVVIIGGTALLAVGMLVMGLLGSQLLRLLWWQHPGRFWVAALLGAPIRYIMINEAPHRTSGCAKCSHHIHQHRPVSGRSSCRRYRRQRRRRCRVQRRLPHDRRHCDRADDPGLCA